MHHLDKPISAVDTFYQDVLLSETEPMSHLRKRGLRVGVVANMVANKVPKRAKTTPFGNQNPTEIPCFISGLRVSVKTAKPLCAGSIPARASNTLNNLY